ncbi:unnamed protein product [Miscanthus lutarioriparius]|uniref:Protein kinase domain-containing protein n=1 Tax=Miscanthus lutarioriparius TaxID=422564 RepID=A0A811SN15_9POAL|nr:unnamed protein product [Miscanthus lutarioriparius]
MTTDSSSTLLSTLPKNIPARFLYQITDYFSQSEIGKGALGTVYKGIAENGEMIAVKKLKEKSDVADYEKTFNYEVCNLMAAQHENIVKLIGYCYEKRKKVVQSYGRYVIVDVTEIFSAMNIYLRKP